MANRLAESFGSGSNGAAVTTGNTSADFVSGTAPTISTSTFTGWPVDGTRSMRVNPSGSNCYVYWNITAGSACWFEFYIRITSLPSSTFFLAAVTAAGGGDSLAELRVLTDGRLQMRNNFLAVWTSTTALATGTVYRIAWGPGITAGKQQCKIYLGNAASPVESSGTSPNYTGGNFGRFHLGAFTATTVDLLLDRINGDSTTELGPVVSAPSVDAGADATIQDTHTAAIDATVSGTTGTPAYAWTVLSGPSTSSGQFSAPTSVDTNFTPAGGPGTYVLRLAVTDDSGVTTDTVTVTVTPLTEQFPLVAASGASWTNEGGAPSVLVAVTDDDNDTRLRSPANPSSAVAKLFFGGGLKPASGQAFQVPVRLVGPADSAFVAKLYQHNDSTLVHANSSVDIDTGDAVVGETDMYDHTISFAAADWASMPDADWAAGPVVRIEVST